MNKFQTVQGPVGPKQIPIDAKPLMIDGVCWGWSGPTVRLSPAQRLWSKLVTGLSAARRAFGG